MTRQMPDSQAYTKKVYHHIIYLALLTHVAYIVIFFIQSFDLLAYYNIFSASFYIAMYVIVKKGAYRAAVSLIHAEVGVFVVSATLLCGWDLGFPFYMISLASLVYFCPFAHRFVPYLFSSAEILIFLGLRLFTWHKSEYFYAPSMQLSDGLYIVNMCAGFAIILYAAFLSEVSAKVTRTELQKENHSLTLLANYDQLTGLYNRYAFLEKVGQTHDATVAIGDIDDFKVINDTYGHTCGDWVLHISAVLLRDGCGEDVDICRWRGEEFVLLFYQTDKAQVSQKLEQVRRYLSEYRYHFGDITLHITMTFGVCGSGEETDVPSMIARADKRMYYGKTHGKNQIVSEDEQTTKSGK